MWLRWQLRINFKMIYQSLTSGCVKYFGLTTGWLYKDNSLDYHTIISLWPYYHYAFIHQITCICIVYAGSVLPDYFCYYGLIAMQIGSCPITFRVKTTLWTPHVNNKFYICREYYANHNLYDKPLPVNPETRLVIDSELKQSLYNYAI